MFIGIGYLARWLWSGLSRFIRKLGAWGTILALCVTLCLCVAVKDNETDNSANLAADVGIGLAGETMGLIGGGGGGGGGGGKGGGGGGGGGPAIPTATCKGVWGPTLPTSDNPFSDPSSDQVELIPSSCVDNVKHQVQRAAGLPCS